MDKKTLFVGAFAFLLIGVVAAIVYFFPGTARFRGTAYAEPYPPAPEIDLARDSGTRFRLSEMRGDIVLLFFGYTSCPDVCPITMGELKQVLDKLGENDAKKVQVVFVTVDPGRDTPETVQKYVDHFDAGFVGLSGSEVQLQMIWNGYGIFREIVEGTSAAGYLVDHTARITLIDQSGNLRLSYGFETPVDDIVHDVKLLLK
jgi:protein SCO1/2